VNATAVGAGDGHPDLISQEQLGAWLGFQRQADIERAVFAHRILFMRGRGGRICTTRGAIERALGGETAGARVGLGAVPDFV
jgi:hypothetical protein